jgi:hypothetical protein
MNEFMVINFDEFQILYKFVFLFKLLVLILIRIYLLEMYLFSEYKFSRYHFGYQKPAITKIN